MARKMGMKVEEFGFGFPPRMKGYRPKGSDTIYSVNWIPLGGFVRIKGESGEHKGDKDSFASKKAWQRFLVLIAGVTMNILLALVLMSVGFMVGMPSVIDDTLPGSAHVEDQHIYITHVLEGSPAAAVGLVAGDEFISINGEKFDQDQGVRTFIDEHNNDKFSLVVKNASDELVSHELSVGELEGYDKKGLGVAFVTSGLVSYGLVDSVVQGTAFTLQLTRDIFFAFVDIIVNLVSGKGPGVELSGPVGIAVITGEVAALGFIHLLQFTALLSINLAIINVLPFPALDGGRILFLAIEKIKGGAVNEKIEIFVHNMGFLLLMLLVVLVTYRDFVTFGDRILGGLSKIISG